MFRQSTPPGAGCECIVTLPEPMDWKAAAPHIAAVASPFTVLIDFLKAPIRGLWVVLTVGGHGKCWSFW